MLMNWAHSWLVWPCQQTIFSWNTYWNLRWTYKTKRHWVLVILVIWHTLVPCTNLLSKSDNNLFKAITAQQKQIGLDFICVFRSLSTHPSLLNLYLILQGWIRKTMLQNKVYTHIRRIKALSETCAQPWVILFLSRHERFLRQSPCSNSGFIFENKTRWIMF